MTRSE